MANSDALPGEDRQALIRTRDVYQTAVDDGVAGYSDTLLSVVANFKNAGPPEGFNAQSMVGKSKRGEVALRLFAVIDEERDVILKMGFRARGCLAMTACASMICMMAEGKSLSAALAIAPDDLKRALDGVPWDKANTTVFAVEGMRALVGDWLIRRGATRVELDRDLPCDADSVECLMCEHCSLRDSRIDLLVAEAVSGAENDEATGEVS